MRKLLSFTVCFIFWVSALNAQQSKLLAGCCDAKPKEEGRCSGNAYCSACSNCSRCAHCSSGGSCGVCASNSRPVRYTAPRTVTPSKSRASYLSRTAMPASSVSKTAVKSTSGKKNLNKKAIVEYHPEEMVAVNSEILKLREGPGNEFEVIEVLQKYDLLMVIAIDGEWLQVKVIRSGDYGYVKAEYVYKT